MDYAKARGAGKVIPLSVSGAFHSSLMRPASDAMVQPVATAAITDPLIPVIANCTALPIDTDLAVRNELVDRSAARSSGATPSNTSAPRESRRLSNSAPGRVLTAIIKRMLRKSTIINVNDANSVKVSL